MTLHRLHAGDGYEYLTMQVASGDRLRDRTRDLTAYYTEHGTPPGMWMGRGAAQLGLSGNVTEAQMQALFGEGLHPNADAIIAAAIASGKTAEQAIADAQLGRMFYEFSSKPSSIGALYNLAVDRFVATEHRRPSWDERTVLRTDAAHQHLTTELARPPHSTEVQAALDAEKANSRKAVAGFDCVFTPAKSISILWGLASPEIREQIWACHLEAIHEVLTFAESRYAVTRRGHNGVMQIDATGLIIAAFHHFDNRAGDPNPHTHAVISGKVCGVDGTWSALDARSLYAAAVSLSSRYNATVTAKIGHRLGFRFEERARGRGKQPVLEVIGVTQAMVDEFSRRPTIVARLEQLVADYRTTHHGRNPGTVTQYRLAQQATLETRSAKPLPKTLRAMLAEWEARFGAVFGRRGVQFVEHLRHLHTDPDSPRPFDHDEVVIALGVALGGAEQLLAAPPTGLDDAIAHQLRHCVFDTPDARTRAVTALRATLANGPDDAVLARIEQTCTARRREIYEPDVIAVEVCEIISRRRATWTEANIRSAVEDRLAVCVFDDDTGLREAVEAMTATIRDEHSLQLSIDPDPIPAALARSNGESVFTVTGATRWTSQAVLDAETRLMDAARTPSAEILPDRTVRKAFARSRRSGRELNAGQQAIVRYLCTTGTQLAVAIGPAGSGKTTMMKAVADAWARSDRNVIALAPSASAARELGKAIDAPARTIRKLLVQARYGWPTGAAAGTMLLVDEAAMAATADLDDLLTFATRHGAVIRCVGDPEQLAAVEAGGIIRTIAADNRSPALTALVRFEDPEEAAATLAVRAGNAEKAWEFYDSSGRVTHGMSDQLRAEILDRYLTDTRAGISAIMIAATLADVAVLNAAAQAAHLGAGTVSDRGGRVALSDSHCGYRGDLIVTRANNPELRIMGGRRKGTQIDNGDLWRIDRIHHNGSITATGTSHRGRVVLPADYIRDHVELGYATTVHRAQGITVTRAYTLLNETLGRALAYVGLTRATENNHMFLATDALVDISGDQQPDDPHEPFRCFARVLARDDDNLSAHDVMRAEQAGADQRVHLAYRQARKLLADTYSGFHLERTLPVYLFHLTQQSPKYGELLDTLALADAHHLDTAELTASIATNTYQDLGQSLAGARDTAAVLRARADIWIRDHLPVTPNPLVLTATDTLATAETSVVVDAVAAANTDVAWAVPARFRALRDAPHRASCPPVPSTCAGTDLELDAYARELRHRILGPTAEAILPHPEAPVALDTPPVAAAVSATGSDEPDTVAAEPELPSRARLERMRGDYRCYLRELLDGYTEHHLYRALPAALYRLASNSRHWRSLLEVIEHAHAENLDTATLLTAIATNNYTDDGESLAEVRDPALELRTRAKTWINDYAQAAYRTAHMLPHPDFAAPDEVSQRLVGQLNRTTASLAKPDPSLLHHRVPDYPGRDSSLIDFVAELHRRIETAERQLNISDSAQRRQSTKPSEEQSPPKPDSSQEPVRQESRTQAAQSQRRHRRRPTPPRQPRRPHR
ncbi:MobF family relaxase [Nocardia sp. NPDC050712]|uniref:MobF family relaxase n=1 Tax=Nocardia sp. NPDC050712 TaxID=3155518 RepID=UPI0033C9ACD2